MKRWYLYGLLICVLVIFAAYSNLGDNQKQDGQTGEVTKTSATEGIHSEKGDEETDVHVDLINQEGEITGEATLSEVKKGVNIHIEAWDLPEGLHGFHIHDKGICEPPVFESAGGHFNPTDAKHGFDHPEGPHAGDLPNLNIGADGKVEENVVADMVTLKKDEENSLLKGGGTSLMIHSGPDDYTSQPAGDSGDRIACGVIKE